MAQLTKTEFESLMQSVYAAIQRSRPAHEVVTGVVIKRDERKKLVWLKDFGEQAIPLAGFTGKVDFYDNNGTTTIKKTATVEPQVPKVGETVVVLRQMGSRRLPKCVGVILSPRGSF